MAFKGALFDMDGTILDTYELNKQFYNAASQKALGRDLTPEELSVAFRSTGKETLMALGFSEEEIDRPGFYADFFGEANRNAEFFDGIPEVLEALHTKGILLGVVTSRTTEEAKRGMEEKPHLKAMFKTFVGCDRVENVKPHKEPALLAVEELGLEPGDCLFIGDSINDLGSAHHAEIPFALAEWGAEMGPEFDDSDYFVKTPMDLLPLFD